VGGGRRAAAVILDFDATPVDSHSEKERAAGHYKGGYASNPLLATCGREVLPGFYDRNAGANNAGDHLTVLDLALAQLPRWRWMGDSWRAPIRRAPVMSSRRRAARPISVSRWATRSSAGADAILQAPRRRGARRSMPTASRRDGHGSQN